MNNKPVAWMLLRDGSCVELTEWFGVMRGWEEFSGDNEKIVPLYTHPADITDEEIVKLHEETSFFGVLDPVKFARAILRKAQEK